MFDIRTSGSIDEEFLNRVVELQIAESLTLDFKRENYGNSDDKKKELLKDVSSFANSAGGFLVIGIDEDEGCASELVPIKDLNAEEEVLRIENLLRDGLEPRVQGITVRSVEVSGGHILVIHVPKSWNPPHRVNFKKSGLFYGRNSQSSYPLDMEEIRQRFNMASEVEQRAKGFIAERTELVTTGNIDFETPFTEPLLLLHLVPLGPDPLQEAADWKASMTDQGRMGYFRPMLSNGWRSRISLEGLAHHQGGEAGPPCDGYTQIFRSGAVEATCFGIAGSGDDSTQKIGSTFITGLLVNNIERYLEGMQSIGVQPPLLIVASLHNVANSILFRGEMYDGGGARMMRNKISLPHIVLDHFPEKEKTSQSIRFMLDTLWQAYGFTECGYLDANGIWNYKEKYEQF